MSKIAILTNFRSWDDAYSVTHVVRPEMICLAEHGHNVSIFTIAGCGQTEWPNGWGEGCSEYIPDYEPALYGSLNELSDDHRSYAENLAPKLIEWFSECDYVLTHDWISTGHNLPLAEALRISAPALKHIPFYHRVHTAPPTIERDWWDLNRYGDNHHIVSATDADRQSYAQAFKISLDRIVAIPPIVDLRILCDFHSDTWAIAEQMPRLIDATFVQVYPATAHMLAHKGLPELITTFGQLKARGKSVCLLVVDSSTGRVPRESTSRYLRHAARNGLTDHELAFTSTLFNGMFPAGLPKRITRELEQLSSIFIYPAHGETFGLPRPETSLVAGVLPVVNTSVRAISEVSGGACLGYEFGKPGFKPIDEREHYSKLVDQILEAAESESSFKQRTFDRQTYNMSAVYRNCYQQIFSAREAAA